MTLCFTYHLRTLSLEGGWITGCADKSEGRSIRPWRFNFANSRRGCRGIKPEYTTVVAPQTECVIAGTIVNRFRAKDCRDTQTVTTTKATIAPTSTTVPTTRGIHDADIHIRAHAVLKLPGAHLGLCSC